MKKSKKNTIIRLENERKSRVICYVMGDKPPFNTRVAGEIIPFLSEQLDKIGEQKKISLYLYTTGGEMLAPFRIVKLIRSYCDEFEVIVPYKAHSAGTLIALGGDKIVMGKLGELTPVDPTLTQPNPSNPNEKNEISVEDLNSYFLLAKEKGGVKDNQMIDVTKILAEKIPPLFLGRAYRAYRMARMLTERLLALHMQPIKEKTKIQKIVSEITGDITIHEYPIDRDEASELGLKVEKVSGKSKKLIDELYKIYVSEIILEKQIQPPTLLNVKNTDNKFDKIGAVLETTDISYEFHYKGKAEQIVQRGQMTAGISISASEWIKKINK
jgi:hypothetical protein